METTAKSKWAIVRIKDGTRFCELEDVSLIEEQNQEHQYNIHRKAVCLIDNKTFKCYDLSIDTLLHLGRPSKYMGIDDVK
jgi:hypothetical protein